MDVNKLEHKLEDKLSGEHFFSPAISDAVYAAKVGHNHPFSSRFLHNCN